MFYELTERARVEYGDVWREGTALVEEAHPVLDAALVRSQTPYKHHHHDDEQRKEEDACQVVHPVAKQVPVQTPAVWNGENKRTCTYILKVKCSFEKNQTV